MNKHLYSANDLPELQASNYGLSDSQTFAATDGLLFANPAGHTSLADVTDYLKKAYCNTLAADFTAVEVR